ncbi:MAG: DNA polymerase III subunit beta [Saprospiraceae bacterium]|nr:DNA polymerase III subunit beta [Saprospiraceae bacterium]
MKFTVSTTSLLKQLQLTSGALTSNPVMPILEDFLLDLKSNSLSISTSNLEVTMNTLAEVNGTLNGKIAVPGKTLLEILKSLPEQPLSFEVNPETKGVEIVSTTGKYKLVGESPNDFPEIEKPTDDDDSLKMNSDQLKNAIDKTAFAASNDEMRQNMRGINLSIDFNQITFATTDAQKLVRYNFYNVNSNVATNLLLTKKSALLLSTILPKNKEVSIYFNKGKAFFEFENFHFAARLIDAKFPDYNSIIPTNNSNILTIGKEEIVSALKRLIIFANKSTSQIVMSLNEASLTMNAQDINFNNEATEQLSCTYIGESLNVALSAKNLLEMISVIDSDTVQFQFSTENKPVLIIPNEQESGEDLLMLIVTNS